MASRSNAQTRREALYETLKRACLDGSHAPGVMLPTKRELGDQYGLSSNAVFGVIQDLANEGLLYTVPRIGTFVRPPQLEKVEPYLMLTTHYTTSRNDFWVQAQAGFEDRIAQLGGHSIVLTSDEANAYLQRNELPPLSGVFGTTVGESLPLIEQFSVPKVLFGSSQGNDTNTDWVDFDDEAGGTIATHHLWQNGHRTIAFLAMHNDQNATRFPWSVRREVGWRKAMGQGDFDLERLVFHPEQIAGLSLEDQLQAAHSAAKNLVGRADITAVVAANIIAAQGMFDAFQEAQWPAQHWPSVVCFDSAPQIGNSIVSYLRLPWEEIGREAAQILWERRNNRLAGSGVQRLTPMRLIPRLSCRPDWAVASGLAQNHTGSNPQGLASLRKPLNLLGE